MQIGSTEWVEENREMLASRAVAYLNVDSAVAGPGFYSYATPQLDELIIDTSKEVFKKPFVLFFFSLDIMKQQ